MSIFKIFSTIVFLYSTIVFAQGNDLNKGIARLLVDNPSIIIIGEDHQNPGLAVGINDLLSTQYFNCLFLELSSDLQLSLDEAVASKNLEHFSQIVIDSKIPAMIHAYQKMGVADQQLESVKSALQSVQKSSLANFPFNQDTLNLLSKNDISLIPYDADSKSQEIIDQTEVVVKDNYWPRDIKRDIEGMRIGNLRSKIMSQNITKQFQVKKCTKAIVVIGYAHLYSSKYFNSFYKSDVNLNPLQDLLSDEGFQNKVIIAERASGSSNTTIQYNPNATRFSRHFGQLINP